MARRLLLLDPLGKRRMGVQHPFVDQSSFVHPKLVLPQNPPPTQVTVLVQSMRQVRLNFVEALPYNPFPLHQQLLIRHHSSLFLPHCHIPEQESQDDQSLDC